jgi:hypothetical protein
MDLACMLVRPTTSGTVYAILRAAVRQGTGSPRRGVPASPSSPPPGSGPRPYPPGGPMRSADRFRPRVPTASSIGDRAIRAHPHHVWDVDPACHHVAQGLLGCAGVRAFRVVVDVPGMISLRTRAGRAVRHCQARSSLTSSAPRSRSAYRRCPRFAQWAGWHGCETVSRSPITICTGSRGGTRTQPPGSGSTTTLRRLVARAIRSRPSHRRIP